MVLCEHEIVISRLDKLFIVALSLLMVIQSCESESNTHVSEFSSWISVHWSSSKTSSSCLCFGIINTQTWNGSELCVSRHFLNKLWMKWQMTNKGWRPLPFIVDRFWILSARRIQNWIEQVVTHVHHDSPLHNLMFDNAQLLECVNMWHAVLLWSLSPSLDAESIRFELDSS